MKKFLLFSGGLLIAVCVAAYFIVPWNTLLEQRISAYLSSRGYENISFRIERIGLYGATFSHISIGGENPLTLRSVTVQYSSKELLQRNFQELTLTGLDVLIVQTEEGWRVGGLDGLGAHGADMGETTGLSDIVDLLPFTSIDVKDSHLRLSGAAVQTALPFNMRLTKSPAIILEMTIDASNLTAASSDVSLGVITIKAASNENRNWDGTWGIESIDFGDDVPVPVLKGGGALHYTGDAVYADGKLASGDNAYRGDFALSVNIRDSGKNTLTLKSASFPFKEGSISTQNALIPFDRSKNIRINANVSKVSLNALMQTLTGRRVSATGTVSGSIPVILRPDGSYTLGQGSLEADNDGVIQLPGDLIPGDNEQVRLVRRILEDLHYSAFSATVDTSDPQGLVVKLTLEGNNPDVYNGRAVKLNVNLTGDVLDFIQQNAMLITNPERFLRRESHE